MTAPWGYVRQKLAERWHCFPWEVDDAPLSEILETLEVLGIEAEARDHHERQARYRSLR